MQIVSEYGFSPLCISTLGIRNRSNLPSSGIRCTPCSEPFFNPQYPVCCCNCFVIHRVGAQYSNDNVNWINIPDADIKAYGLAVGAGPGLPPGCVPTGFSGGGDQCHYPAGLQEMACTTGGVTTTNVAQYNSSWKCQWRHQIGDPNGSLYIQYGIGCAFPGTTWYTDGCDPPPTTYVQLDNFFFYQLKDKYGNYSTTEGVLNCSHNTIYMAAQPAPTVIGGVTYYWNYPQYLELEGVPC